MQKRFVLVPVVLSALLAVGADWMQFRGPGGSGRSNETGLPTTWDNKNGIVWRAKLIGPGTSSPITVGKRVFVTCYSGYGVEPGKGNMQKLMRHVMCIDRGNGTILWTRDFKPDLPEWKYIDSDACHGYSSSTPASDGKHIYVFFGKSGVYCLDLYGKEIWHANVGSKIAAWGSPNSPVIYKGLVIINASIESETMIALDKNTGKEVWRAEGILRSWSTPEMVEVPGSGTELVIHDPKGITGFDPDTGKQLWHVKDDCRGATYTSVLTHKDVVYLRRESVLAIRAGGRGDVTDSHVLWRVKSRGSVIPSPIYHDGHLYTPGCSTYMDAATGKEDSSKNVRTGGGFYASALVADGKIYWVSRFDGTFVLEPGMKLLAHNKFEDDDSRTNASPIVSDGCLIMRTDRYLYCIGKK